MKTVSARKGFTIAVLGLWTAVACSKSSEPTAVTPPDTQAPTIAVATPADAADGVALNTTVQIKLSEPVIIGSGGGIRVTHQGAVIPGSTTISSDSLTLTFAPSGALSPNAIYRAGFLSVGDKAGNAIPGSTSACFITTTAGSTRVFTAVDPGNDYYRTAQPPVFPPPDIVGIRFVRDVSQFAGVVQFSAPRAFLPTATNRAGVYIDLDTDQDSTTGVVTLKDTLFAGSNLGLTTSGMRAEYLIDLEPDPSYGDSAEVARYVIPPTADSVAFVTYAMIPDVCGTFMGFTFPWTAIGNDDGNFNVVMLGIVGDNIGVYADPMPDNGHLTLSLPLVAPPIAQTAVLGPQTHRVRRGGARVLPRVPLRTLH